MKKTAILLLCLGTLGNLKAQQSLTPDTALASEIIKSGLLHRPLPLDLSRSAEAAELKKKVLVSEPLQAANDPSKWRQSGYGKLSYAGQVMYSGAGSFRLAYPTSTGKRATGSASDPDYAVYGSSQVRLDVQGADWSKFNRIEFFILPVGEGSQVVNINFNFENGVSSGQQPHEADHLINLTNNQWNHCFFDLTEYQRNKVKEIGFSVTLKGRNLSTGDSVSYYFNHFSLQSVEPVSKLSGWEPADNKIVYSGSGYGLNDRKTAIANGNTPQGKQFQLVDAMNGKTVFTGTVLPSNTSIGAYNILDFSTFNKAGTYALKWGKLGTPSFVIGKDNWTNSLWRVLNFIFCQRCGYAVPGIHGDCHNDLSSQHDGKKISYAGGWHDAGDLSQQTLQTGDVTYALFEAYNKQKAVNPALAERLREEAEWGLDFILKNRYGDGYRASSMGLLIWQDGITGTLDDINSVRVQNNSFDNFLYAGYEAYAAMSMQGDTAMQQFLRRVASQDFAFALDKHRKSGYGGFTQMFEHSLNTSESQYKATISWAASMLYKLTRDPAYAVLAAEHIRYTLNCQRSEPLQDAAGTLGFFYRDSSRKSIVHFVHQSREQVFMQAMALLCETQPGHADYQKWAASIKNYGGYLKGLMHYTAPYGMLPGGVYHKGEAEDSAAFFSLHLFPPPNTKELYRQQVMNGVQLDSEHWVKRFPVWFSIFNGNEAVLLSTGKAAAICGHFLHDEELLRIAKEQLYWTVGKNPFGQSLIFGEGNNYPRMDSFSSGEMMGEMPVGIRSLGDADIPYWPATNNATYKEVWVTSAGKWFSLLSEF